MLAREPRVGQGLGVAVPDHLGILLERGLLELGCDLESLGLASEASRGSIACMALDVAATLGRFDLGALASTLR